MRVGRVTSSKAATSEARPANPNAGVAPRRRPLLDLESEFQGSDKDDIRPAKVPKVKDDSQGSRGVAASSAENIAADGAKDFAWMDSDDDDNSKSGKTKEFAWMDSDDDANDVDSKCDSRKSRKSRSRSRSCSAAENSALAEAELPLSVADVNTFSQMMRMVDKLKARVPEMAPAELAQSLAAAARVKFFDASFLQELLIPRVRFNLGDSKRRSPFLAGDLVSILCSLADLNCFDKDIFGKILRELASKRGTELEVSDRSRIRGACKAVKYEGEEDQEVMAFLQWLLVTAKSQRYEAMCSEQRMIVGNSKSGMHAPEGYLRSFIVGTTSKGVEVKRPQGMVS